MSKNENSTEQSIPARKLGLSEIIVGLIVGLGVIVALAGKDAGWFTASESNHATASGVASETKNIDQSVSAGKITAASSASTENSKDVSGIYDSNTGMTYELTHEGTMIMTASMMPGSTTWKYMVDGDHVTFDTSDPQTYTIQPNGNLVDSNGYTLQKR